MLISIDWINDFVELPDLDAKEIGSRFTLATAEVEDVITSGTHFEKIHVAEIISINKHPEADKLNLVTLKLNQKGDTIEVVCGGQNVRVGLKIPYAPTGTTLPCGLTLEPKKIRGVLSEGMLCSEEELGYAEESSGIMELADDAPVGVNLIEYFKEVKDTLLEVDNKSITHRPDLWGHYGMAREFATIFEKDLKKPFSNEWAASLKSKFSNDASPITPVVHKESCCLGYFGLSVDGIKVTESPDWMKRRLNSCGLRPINSIVDISNYVMLELGMPLHIFDRAKIQGDKLFIRKVDSETEFVTLDEENRKLIPSDTVIADSKEPLVLGGLMGGLNSGVDESSQSIFIEVANWKAADVRRTSTRLGLRTDSSQRYEKTLDSSLMERTMLRTLELILEFNPEAKVIGKLEYDGEDIALISKLALSTSVKKIEAVLGHAVGKERIISIFKSLDFEIEESGDELKVLVPSYRATKDIDCEADLIEEIGRIVGYDNIAPVSPEFKVSPVSLSESQKLQRKIRDFMVFHASSNEVMTYPLIGEKMLKKAQWPVDTSLKLLNALSEDADRMRPSIVPSLLESASLNAKNFSKFRLFELGKSYLEDDKTFSKESNQLAIAYFDKEESCYMDLVNTVERLMSSLNIPGDICERHPKFKNALIPEEWVGTHPYEFLNVRIMGKMHGVISSIHPVLLKQYKIKGNLSIAIIDLSAFENQKMKDKTKYRPLAKFPSSTFDCTVVADKEKSVGQVLDALKKAKVKELKERSIVDVFVQEDGRNAITIRSVFADPNKTLDSEQIKKGEEAVIQALDKAGFPLKA